MREAAAVLRGRALDDLDGYPLRFEQEATARGAVVHWAESAADVNRILADIAAQHGVRAIVKAKSMVSEECGLNDALAEAGLEVLETDLGEYILQLAHEPPSHIVAPVVHVAVTGIEKVVPILEDAPTLLRLLPRAVTFVSGPSRTADIEPTITLGAHGPYRVFIVVVDERPAAADSPRRPWPAPVA
jgi:L-lactate utilization protein LutB